ncbi:oxidoreductase [Apiospora marii]|uniref:Oxidoreductase n=1 Tax=Apiospora marii TaxID=335849 RepID=A0ABR1RCC2_9PEZI
MEMHANDASKCSALTTALGTKMFLPGSAEYGSSLASYYSLDNSNATPLCIVSPETAEDVSATIRTLTDTATGLSLSSPETEEPFCPFAIRSGGHMTSASNIDGGVTIDLRALNSISVSEDRSLASIGVGATWDAVYAHLDPLGLSVNGGRAAGVGVGGLSLGGGISYTSPRYGFTCDSVVNYQIVFANGTIADSKNDADLLLALRGAGAGNFGVVTRVDIAAFEQGPIWGGMTYHPTRTAADQIEAFDRLASADEYDEHASQILTFAHSALLGGMLPVTLIVNEMQYTKAESRPAVFEPVMNLSRFYSTMRLAGMADFAKEGGGAQPKGLCQISTVLTYESNIAILNATYSLWQDSLADIKGIAGITWSLSLEPLPSAIYKKGAVNNALGLGDRTAPLVVVLLTASFKYATDKPAVEAASRKLMSAIEEEARRQGVFDPWVYLGYATPWQDPIASYGEESLKRLREVQRRVDPHGMFRRQVPGGFKIRHDTES